MSSLRLYITGASSAGVTTLGAQLARRLNLQHIDVDDHYWLPTEPPYTTKRPPEQRVERILSLRRPHGWVLTGSCETWGEALIRDADLILFLVTPRALRIQRLVQREQARYGDRILPGGDLYAHHQDFLNWALQYEHPAPEHQGRSLARHEAWLASRDQPILRLDGSPTPEKLVEQVITALEQRDLLQACSSRT